MVEIYTLKEKFNATSHRFVYIAEKVITLRAEEPQPYGKFGAVAESDGQDMLWISSGWANEEDGVVWSYNVREGLSNIENRELEFEERFGEGMQQIFEARQHDVAKVFAHGNEPKVVLLGSNLIAGAFWGFFACGGFEWGWRKGSCCWQSIFSRVGFIAFVWED